MIEENKTIAELLETLRTERAMRKQAEAAIRASETRYRALFDEAVDGIMLMTVDHITLRPSCHRDIAMDFFFNLVTIELQPALAIAVHQIVQRHISR